jgi:hypothetical protein
MNITLLLGEKWRTASVVNIFRFKKFIFPENQLTQTKTGFDTLKGYNL